jgi:site-specific DNA-methyltransferase (adenine-specific)
MKSEVFNIDCVVGMKDYPDKYFDVCFTDFPYGNDTDYGTYDDSKENTIELIRVAMPEILRVSKRAIITSGSGLMYKYPEPDKVGCWYCPAGVGRSSHGFICWQPILIYGKDLKVHKGCLPDSLEWTGSIDKDASFHPCPKPLNLWKKLFKRWIVESDKKILDPFLGSGTSRIVCDLLGLDFTGFELDKDYYEAQEKRWRDYKAQLTLFK